MHLIAQKTRNALGILLMRAHGGLRFMPKDSL